MDREAIENLSVDRNVLDGSRICREAMETNSRKFRWIEDAIRSIEKKQSKVRMLPSCSNCGFLSLLQGFPHTSYISLVTNFFFLFKCASFSFSIITFFCLFEFHVKASIFSSFFMQMYCQITYFTSLYKLKSNLHVQYPIENNIYIYIYI